MISCYVTICFFGRGRRLHTLRGFYVIYSLNDIFAERNVCPRFSSDAGNRFMSFIRFYREYFMDNAKRIAWHICLLDILTVDMAFSLWKSGMLSLSPKLSGR